MFLSEGLISGLDIVLSLRLRIGPESLWVPHKMFVELKKKKKKGVKEFRLSEVLSKQR